MVRLQKTIAAIMVIGFAACSTAPEPAEPLPLKRVALSFDDAPMGNGPAYTGTERTAALLEALARAETGPVAMFVTTDGFDDEPDGRARVEAYANAGHLIANHSHSHPWASRTDTEEYLADIARAEAMLEGLPNRRAWYRYPYLDEGRAIKKRDDLVRGLNDMGLTNGYVTIDTYDWYVASAWQKAERAGQRVDLDALQSVYIDMILTSSNFYHDAAMTHLGRAPAQVLLLHENDLAAAFIDEAVAALRADGWTIISPDEAYADALAEQVPTTLLTGQGRVMALAVDAGADPRSFTHLGIEDAELDALMEERQVFREPN